MIGKISKRNSSLLQVEEVIGKINMKLYESIIENSKKSTIYLHHKRNNTRNTDIQVFYQQKPHLL